MPPPSIAPQEAPPLVYIREGKQADILQNNIRVWQAELKRRGVDTAMVPRSPFLVDGESKSGWLEPERAEQVKRIAGATEKHRALDVVPSLLAVPASYKENAPVVARVDAVVLFAGKWLGGSGGSGDVVIYGGDDGWIYSESHAKEGSILVVPGQRVGMKDHVFTMGMTGAASGNTVHLVDRRPIVPLGEARNMDEDFERVPVRIGKQTVVKRGQFIPAGDGPEFAFLSPEVARAAGNSQIMLASAGEMPPTLPEGALPNTQVDLAKLLRDVPLVRLVPAANPNPEQAAMAQFMSDKEKTVPADMLKLLPDAVSGGLPTEGPSGIQAGGRSQPASKSRIP